MQEKTKSKTHKTTVIIFIGMQVICEEITLEYRSSNGDKLQKGRFSSDNRKKKNLKYFASLYF